jgi:hypothetical protein
MFRQGDVLIIPLTPVNPEWPHVVGLRPVPRDEGRVVLAYGEVTGHAHAILDAEVELWETEGRETAAAADRFLRVGSAGATVVHEEHGEIKLPPGDYAVRLQTTFDPTNDEEQLRQRWLAD